MRLMLFRLRIAPLLRQGTLMFAAALGGVACGSSPAPPLAASPAAPTPSAVAVPTSQAAPSPAAIAAQKTPEEAAAGVETTSCEGKTDLRQAAGCYLTAGTEASIDPLFEIGRKLAKKAVKFPLSYWPDFIYAAENAGTIAAKTHDARLYEGIAQASEADQLFAVHALRQMLAKLRWGQINGKDPDGLERKERLPQVHPACLGKIHAPNPMLVNAAADCLKEIADPADTAALIDVGATNPSIEVQDHVLDIASRGGDPFPTTDLQKLQPLLETPLTAHWHANDITARASACRILHRGGASGQAWARKAAQTAATEVGTRIGPASRDACLAVANGTP